MFCSNCGNALPDNANFCNKCGHKIEKEDQPFTPHETSTTIRVPATPLAQSEDYEEMVSTPANQDARAAALNQMMNNQASGNPKKKKKKFKISFALVVCVVFVISIIIALIPDYGIGNLILLGSGFIEIIASIVLFVVADKKRMETCPECGEKREHKRYWSNTTEKISSFNEYNKHSFTHYFDDYYICPSCGKTLKQVVTKSGGSIYLYHDGRTSDSRISYNRYEIE